ncbi:hypothetical protein KAB08_02699 [Acinetobacter baumannii]|nr:hypothetical protein KAB08_02699 [Acinetobacter baumannii]
MHEITLNEVRQLIASLRTVYAAQFNKQFPATGESAIPLSVVEQIALKTLVGAQFNALLVTYSRWTLYASFAEFRTGVSVKVGCLQKKLGLAHVSLQLTVPWLLPKSLSTP